MFIPCSLGKGLCILGWETVIFICSPRLHLTIFLFLRRVGVTLRPVPISLNSLLYGLSLTSWFDPLLEAVSLALSRNALPRHWHRVLLLLYPQCSAPNVQ